MSNKQGKELAVFFHMIYELNKGLRNLALLTTTPDNLEIVKERLEKCNYEFLVEELEEKYVNIFFGTKEPIEVLKRFSKDSLKKYSPEEDFILGVLLGYNTEQQCKRYLKMKSE
jgi:hypothetical protein